MSNVDVINFGCRLNIAEGEAIRAAAAGETDLIIINSCAVTKEAERQARQAIRSAAKRRPDARIIVTGCAAQTAPTQFTAMPEVTRVIGNLEKYVPAEFARRNSREAVSDIFGLTPPLLPIVSGRGHARAFVAVQNGCDHRCTFCIIPYGRGNSRSVPAGLVIDAIQKAVDAGQQEAILTGVDLTSYGPDLPGAPTLGQLVERILQHVPDLQRLRLSSLDSVEIDDRLADIIATEPRLMPHLHMSLQSGDNMILKRMKRRHSREQAISLIMMLKSKRPEISVGADIIAGFPTETDEMFANSLDMIEACDIVFGHIFPYSPREGTPAARMPQVDRAIIRARAAKLRAASDVRKAEWLASLVGSQQRMLVELGGETGHGENFAGIRLDKPQPAGAIVDVVITASDGDRLMGTPA